MSDSNFSQNLSSSRELLQLKKEEEQFLRFRLEPDTKVMLPIEQITEVLKIAVGNIVPIPEMPAWVMGVYNWRGEILWMLDLGHLIGLNSWYETGINATNYNALVLSQDNSKNTKAKSMPKTSLGLIITQVEDIEWCNPALIQSPPASAISDELAPFLQGYWLKSDGETIWTLNGLAIFAAMSQS
ncbi:MAG: chemotaxis protein CheW [Xenococcaceae cyanobacterium MO_188.B32]|nr:chemotaxis protein CheW [Xenococcaceae cyanobacterium MO_188.B32]